MKAVSFIMLLFTSLAARSQKIETIYFNLYTDSLKKGIHNYINVDGKMDNGTFLPLMSDDIIFTSTAGKWQGNSIIIDSAIKIDSVVVTAVLKARPEVKKSVTIYIKKTDYQPSLKTEKELLDEWTKKSKKKNK
jgi:hypothetical protein